MKLHTPEEDAEFASRAAVWTTANFEPVAARIRLYAETSERGKPQAAKVYLRHVASKARTVANVALSEMVAGLAKGAGLTAIAGTIASRVAAKTGRQMDTEEQAIQVGYWLISAICDVTGAAAIVDKHGDRPEQTEGGVKLTPTYELQVTDGKFLSDAVEYGAAGMPTYSLEPIAPWQSQKVGGLPGRAKEFGMVHGAGAAMRGVTSSTAPALFEALNHAKAARFRVNPVTGGLVLGYDAAKARAWLVQHFMDNGKTADEAARLAADAARL